MPVAKRVPGAQEMADRIDALEEQVARLTDVVELLAAENENPAGPMSLDDVD